MVFHGDVEKRWTKNIPSLIERHGRRYGAPPRETKLGPRARRGRRPWALAPMQDPAEVGQAMGLDGRDITVLCACPPCTGFSLSLITLPSTAAL